MSRVSLTLRGTAYVAYEVIHVLGPYKHDDDWKQFPLQISVRQSGKGADRAYQGTIVILNPTRAQTLRDVIVLTAISTMAVNVTPSLEWTAFMRLKDHTTYAEKIAYAP